LKRGYYSAFCPVPKTPFEFKDKTPLSREHRLYNIDFMMRKYSIALKEFEGIMTDGNLPRGDPKMHLARNYFDRPIDVNDATQEELLRIPGIGPLSAKRIISLRSNKRIKKREELHSIGVVLKRAEGFLKIDGMMQLRIGAFA